MDRTGHLRVASRRLFPWRNNEDVTLGPDPYSVLGVSRDATGEQIARARHQLVLRYHPDVNHDPHAAERFDEVQQAFHLLSDPAARAEYDRARDEQGRALAAPRSGAATGAAAGVLVQPAAVDFGRLVPGGLAADCKVAVTWTGAPSSRITSNPGGECWTNLRMTRLGSSGVVFYLSAQAPARAPSGHRRAEFTVTLDGIVVTVPLTAYIGQASPPDPPPDFEPGGFIRRDPRTPWAGAEGLRTRLRELMRRSPLNASRGRPEQGDGNCTRSAALRSSSRERSRAVLAHCLQRINPGSEDRGLRPGRLFWAMCPGQVDEREPFSGQLVDHAVAVRALRQRLGVLTVKDMAWHQLAVQFGGHR
jgi:DnaJ-like protein